MSASAIAAPAVGRPSPAQVEALSGIDRPTKRDEAWRYAPHAELARLRFGPAAQVPPAVPADVLAQIPAIDGPRIVVVNGVVDHDLSDISSLPDGVHVSSLAVAADEHPELVAAHVGQDSDQLADAFVALNIAFGADGAAILVDAGHRIEVPIHLVDIVVADTTPNAEAPNAWCSGAVIHLRDGSAATVIETRIGAGGELSGSNTRTTITLGEGATLEHIVAQDAASTQIQLTRVEVTQQARSVLRARSFNLGAHYGRLAYDVQLAGAGAVAEMSGLYFGFGEQTLDQQITVVHDAVDCTSRQSYRGVLDDESTGVFNGGIDVRPGAGGADAEQSNDNLLLSRRAEVNTQPRLEILTDEVACKHGATVGELDETALYYMRSRGIPESDARSLLVRGFAEQVVEDVDVAALRGWIEHRLRLDRDG